MDYLKIASEVTTASLAANREPRHLVVISEELETIDAAHIQLDHGITYKRCDARAFITFAWCLRRLRVP
jgi:hypothetical protein